MGLFSDKTVLTAGVSISPLVPEVPNLARSAIKRAAFNGWEYPGTIVDAILSGHSINPEAYYKYGAKTPDGFVNGLPTSTSRYTIDRNELFKDIAGDIIGFDTAHMFFEYSDFAVPTNYEIMYHWYRHTFQMVYALGGSRLHVKEYLKLEPTATSYSNISMITPQSYTLTKVGNDWEVSVRFFVQRYAGGNITLDYNGIIRNGDFNITNYEAPVYRTRFNTLINYNDFAGYSVLYDIAQGLYKELDPAYTDPIEDKYYPIMPIRVNKKFINETDNAELYTSGTTLLKHINANIKTLQDAIADNPDVDLVDDSFVMLGLPIGKLHEQTDATLAYFYKFFQYLQASETVSEQQFLDSVDETKNPSLNPAFNVLKVNSGEFKQEMYWAYTKKTIDRGSYGVPAGREEYSLAFSRTIIQNVPYRDPWDYDQTDDRWFSRGSITITKTTSTAKVYYTIVGLFTASYVIDNGTKPVLNDVDMAFASGDPFYDDQGVWRNLPFKDGLFIPLNRRIMSKLSKSRQTEIALKGTLLVNYAIREDKIDWYKRPAFWNFVRIVAFIISVVTYNPQISVAVEAAASEVIAYILENILIDYLIDKAIGYVLSLLVDAIGGDAALILAAIAVAYGVTSALSTITINIGLPFATELYKVSTLLLNKIGDYTVKQFNELRNEMEDFASDAQDALEALKEIQSTLVNGYFDPYWYMEKAGIVTGETPDNFYKRTIGITSVEGLGLDAISNFHASKLTLPTVDDLLVKFEV